MSSRADVSVVAAFVALRRIIRYLRLADREIENVCGLSVAQLFVLHQLAETSALSISDIAARSLTDASSVSTVVARLVDVGLVTRKASRKDRRRAELTLTPRGHRVLLTAPRAPQAAIIGTIRAMSRRRRAELVRSLEGLAAGLGANAVEPRMLFEDEPEPHRRIVRTRRPRRATSVAMAET